MGAVTGRGGTAGDYSCQDGFYEGNKVLVAAGIALQ